MLDPDKFAEKYQLALEAALREKPNNGLCGVELEWNLLDDQLRPLLTVGSGPGQKSFVDYLRSEALPPWVVEYSQLEVFHWMIEWATRPYYSPRGTVYEARLMEGILLNALDKVGRQFGRSLYAWHGNLLYKTAVGHQSIPDSWHLAKRRYLERCVDLYGDALATAGTHANLSLPEPLLAWDFMHLSPADRGDTQFDEYKSQFYITATRLMRAFASLFIATSASTPFQADLRDGQPVVVLKDIDSIRNLTFPNPESIDLPDLYRSYDDYLHQSYELVRSGVRFGNNNWTPVRARSFAEPVERLIAVTSDQLNDLYSRGLYVLDSAPSMEEMAAQIEKQNLLARINLPMSRVEVRTDDGCHPMDLEIANLTLKYLLLVRIYADPQFARAFRYDREDIHLARSNEELAARHGLKAEISNPFTGKPVPMREFLSWTLDELQPLAEVLDMWSDLAPLVAMVDGMPNTAQRMRDRLKNDFGVGEIVPPDVLRQLAQERHQQVLHDIEQIAGSYTALDGEATKFSEFLQRARDDVHADPQAAIRFNRRMDSFIELNYADTTSEVLPLAQELIRIPSVTACPQERLDEVRRAATLIYDYAKYRGLGVRYYYQEKYPALLIGFPGRMHAPVMLAGHFDVVEPDPDDSQFEPSVDGDYLWGRGAADMKTVVATYLVWMKDMLKQGPPFPPVNLLLVGNEENGEIEAMGTPHVLRLLADEDGYQPQLFVAGERTGESGNELWGEICIENRGLMRFSIIGRGRRDHTGVAQQQRDLTERMLEVKADIAEILNKHLTLASPDGWHSQAKFPFIQVGTAGIYNISADQGLLGVEVRPIPQDDLVSLRSEIQSYCEAQDLEISITAMENGIACRPDNPYLSALIEAVEKESSSEARLGRKLPGTSARFAPGGQGVVWGQSGIGPHARAERHYIPSIETYYRALRRFGSALVDKNER
ncbi:MAG: M20/M25/M40 family metallo-hydrolase [Anaerolineales bacterium]